MTLGGLVVWGRRLFYKQNQESSILSAPTMSKTAPMPLFEIVDNPKYNIRTGEFTNVLPDGSPGSSGDRYRGVLQVIAPLVLADVERNKCHQDTRYTE